ncbi:MAG: carboxymuconolactone decarboxylase family protein [Actinomycetota bacterium]|nr:carboxymuconolactone decarboxylase family protein [Actinomycetota bacterium]
MSRIPLLAADEAPLLSRGWYGTDGRASPLTRSLATAPDLLETLMPFLGQVMGEGAVDLATKELVIVRVSQLNGCRYCLAVHRPLAAEAGVPAFQLAAVCAEEPVDVLAPRERALVAWIDALTLDPRRIDDELVASTLDHLREDQLVELTVLAGAITMLNQYCTALDLPPPSLP